MAKHLLDSAIITILAQSALMLSVQSLHQIFFKIVISILTYPYWLRSAAMHTAQRLQQLFPDKCDRVKFITIIKATKEEKSN